LKRRIADFFGAQSEFTKNVMRLVGSSTVAIAITLISLPIITRIYSPEDFGQFQILLSTVGVLSVITSFRYEIAIVLPKGRAEASAVYTLALIFLVLTTLLIALAFFFFGGAFLGLLNAEVLEPYLFLMCIAIFLAGVVQVLRYAITREKRFKELGGNRVIEAASAQGMKISLGLFSPTFLSLFISQVAGYVLSFVLAAKYKKTKLNFSRMRLRWALRKYNRFILYNTPAVLVNTVALQLPVFMIARFFGPELVGYYVLAVKLIEVPLKIVGNAISQVYYKQAADIFHSGPERLLSLYQRTVAKLSLVMIFPAVLVITLAEPVVPYVLGESWSEVGSIMMFLVVWKFFEFINYPVSTTLTVINEQHIDLGLKCVFSLGLRFFALAFFNETQTQFFVALVVSASLYYIIFNLVAYQRVKRRL
jgi:O-antigen/teichoic acid export membrane protein|tara:strand:- start:14157 stop:15419 length:1263 start_codon:yes stop_codon:yes gene_type:complete